MKLTLPSKLRFVLLAAIPLAILTAIVYFKVWRPKTGPNRALAAIGGESMSVRIDVPSYQQFDPRWRTINLGNTDTQLGSYGCTVCATAMALTARGVSILPDQLNAELIKNEGFTKSGLLIWSAVKPVSGNNFSIKVIDQPTHAVIDQQLEKNNPVIAKVLYKDSIWHWVLITGKEGKEYLVHDPLSHSEGHDRLASEYSTGIYSTRFLKP